MRFVRYRDRATVYNNKKNLKGFNDNENNGYKFFVNEADRHYFLKPDSLCVLEGPKVAGLTMAKFICAATMAKN